MGYDLPTQLDTNIFKCYLDSRLIVHFVCAYSTRIHIRGQW